MIKFKNHSLLSYEVFEFPSAVQAPIRLQRYTKKINAQTFLDIFYAKYISFRTESVQETLLQDAISR